MRLNAFYWAAKKINVGNLRRRQTGVGLVYIHLCIAGDCHLGGKANLNFSNTL